jgi:hypothetical protein
VAKTKNKSKVSYADQVRLGPDVAAAKARMSSSDWKSLVKTAHSKGFSVAGMLSGAPDALKERTRSSLVDEANKTVNSAFKPASDALNQQESGIHALDAKRQADEAHFQSWLKSQQDSMAARALSADQQLASQQQAIQDQTRQGYAEAQQNAYQNAAATPGNVSDPHSANALNLSADAQRANDNVAAQRQATASMTNNARGYLVGAQGVSAGLAQQAQVQRASDTSKALNDVGKQRSDLLAKSASAAADEIQRLFSAEADKADANRNYVAAAQKLGVSQAAVEQRATAAAVASADKAASRKTQVSIANAKIKSAESLANKRLSLDKYRIASTAEQKQLDRALKTQLASKGKAVSSADLRLSSTTAARLSKIKSDIQSLRTKATKRPLRQIVTGRGASDLEYELALDLAVNGKLSKLNQQRAKQLGILNPEDL